MCVRSSPPPLDPYFCTDGWRRWQPFLNIRLAAAAALKFRPFALRDSNLPKFVGRHGALNSALLVTVTAVASLVKPYILLAFQMIFNQQVHVMQYVVMYVYVYSYC